ESTSSEVLSTVPAYRRTMLRLAVSLTMIVAGWAIVTSPLLVRNMRMYGKATYNVNNWLLFVDEFEQPVELSQRLTLDEAAQQYWESHTVAAMIEREGSGLVWETFMLLRMLGPCPLDDSRVLFGLPLAVLALIGILARPRSEHLLLGLWTVLFVTLFAWYVPIAAGERFLMPLLAPILICASEGLVRMVHLAGQRPQPTALPLDNCG
ncbi:MAG: hypothetical protein KF861_09265, partial [Planctomycetaceae bacterium]|nr:hypothetical protein [Planctomycetaceae bacterium]